jgi:hypothetical protein
MVNYFSYYILLGDKKCNSQGVVTFYWCRMARKSRLLREKESGSAKKAVATQIVNQRPEVKQELVVK